MKALGKTIANLIAIALVLPFGISNSRAEGSSAIDSYQPYTANIQGVGNIWKGNIPSSLTFPSDKSSITLSFPIEGLLPYKTLSDRATGVEVEFDLWSSAGQEIASKNIYSSSWNPVGPETLVEITLFKSDLFGDFTFIIKTQYELSTNGLLTRFLETSTRIPLKIKGIDIPKTKPTGALIEVSEDFTANIATVGNIWKGKIPTRISYPLATSYQYVYFDIEGLLPYSTLADRATGVEVEFELWSSKGKKIADETVYTFDWNPIGPLTQVALRLSEADAIGNHTLIIRTIYEVSTTGLLTRYLKQEEKRNLTIISRKKAQAITFKQIADTSIEKGNVYLYSSDLSSTEYSLNPVLVSQSPSVCSVSEKQIKLLSVGLCSITASQPGNDSIAAAAPVTVSFRVLQGRPKTPTSITATRQGSNITYSLGDVYEQGTQFEVGISHIITASLSPSSSYSFYSPVLWKTSSSSTFTMTGDEIKTYLDRMVLSYPLSDAVVLVRIRAKNDLGVSDWSNGVYSYARDLGISGSSSSGGSSANSSGSSGTGYTTITCVKGKVVKKISAISPKCPKGYKKR